MIDLTGPCQKLIILLHIAERIISVRSFLQLLRLHLFFFRIAGFELGASFSVTPAAALWVIYSSADIAASYNGLGDNEIIFMQGVFGEWWILVDTTADKNKSLTVCVLKLYPEIWWVAEVTTLLLKLDLIQIRKGQIVTFLKAEIWFLPQVFHNGTLLSIN